MADKRRKKLRVELRKNRQTRARQQNLTQRLQGGDEELDKLAGQERLSGKGDLTRRRTIVGADDADSDMPLRDVDLANCVRGRVISAVGLTSEVQADDGRTFECTVRRMLRMMSVDQRSAVVAGDHVFFQPTSSDQGVIERVEPRRGVLSRISQRREHVLVANVDQALIVTSAADPPPKRNFVNRFLLSAAKGDVRAIVCVNKIDLVDRARLEPLAGAYARLGYHALLVSARDPSTLVQLRSLLAGQQTVLAGQSGVGKTSLLNALRPGLDLRVGEVSEDSRKGRHTTRAARLIALDDGGWIVDTPGIRELGLWGVLPEEVEGYFIEFRPFVTRCKFPDCTHTHEQGCGVKQAVDERLISAARYESYVRIFQGDIGGDD